MGFDLMQFSATYNLPMVDADLYTPSFDFFTQRDRRFAAAEF
jgi:hypothetical protein